MEAENKLSIHIHSQSGTGNAEISDGSILLEENKPFYNQGGLTATKATFLLFRSIVGVGVLSMPYETQQTGIFGTLILIPIYAIAILFSLDGLFQIANEINYKGDE